MSYDTEPNQNYVILNKLIINLKIKIFLDTHVWEYVGIQVNLSLVLFCIFHNKAYKQGSTENVFDSNHNCILANVL